MEHSEMDTYMDRSHCNANNLNTVLESCLNLMISLMSLKNERGRANQRSADALSASQLAATMTVTTTDELATRHETLYLDNIVVFKVSRVHFAI